MQITNHTQLLNALIDKYNLNSYLEIGVQNPANNFDKIKCDSRTGCDPDLLFREDKTSQIFHQESDNFFISNSGIKYDLIFIDGLHHADQVKRDFENSLRCLSDNGFIVIHDVLPENEAGTKVPRETKQWWGDVYKWAMGARQYPYVKVVTYDIDNGCMVICKDPEKHPFIDINQPCWYEDWGTYINIGRELMNVTSTVEI